MPVKTIALNGFTPSFPDCMFKRCDGLLLRSGRTRHVENFFLDDRAVQIIHTVTERNLCERQPHAHPISREMVDIIEINTADGQIAELLERRRGFHVRKDSRLRFESKRDEPGKTAGFVLQLTELAQMIDAVSKGLDMSVKHRACAAAAHSMPGSVDVEPFLGRFFPSANLVAYNRIENFRAAACD